MKKHYIANPHDKQNYAVLEQRFPFKTRIQNMRLDSISDTEHGVIEIKAFGIVVFRFSLHKKDSDAA